jgi:hypothetical protein
VLWSVGGALDLKIAGSHSFTLPGYLGVAAVAYAIITGSFA